MRGLLFLVGMLLGIPSLLNAQTICEAFCTARVGEPIYVQALADETAVSYRLVVNGTPSATPWRMNGPYVEFAFPSGIAKGDYAFRVEVILREGSAWTGMTDLAVRPGKGPGKGQK